MSFDDTHPTKIEHLPTEIFLQIFASFSLKETVTSFSGLNAHIDSIIRCLKGAIHEVNYDDTKAMDLLGLFATQIGRLTIIHATTVDLTSLINLRSLTIKHGTVAQFDGIRPQNFPMLEILHICDMDSHSRQDGTRSLIDLFQVILSNGFPRLRICTTAGIEFLDSNEAWTGSSALRCLILNVRTVVAYEQILFRCPNLRRFNSVSHLPIDIKPEGIRTGQDKRVLAEIRKIQQWESEKKFILDYCSLFDDCNSWASSYSMKPTQYSNGMRVHVIRGRIFPDKDPYCYASFLIEIRLPSEYPFKRPDMFILDPIYHPNVESNGSHCCCWGLGDEPFRPTEPLTDCIRAVIETIHNINSDHTTSTSCAVEYLHNYETFYRKALEHTLEYGRPRC